MAVSSAVQGIMIGAELVRGQRGSTLLKYDGFIYRTSNQSSRKIHWQCDEYRHRRCLGALWTYHNGEYELRQGHNHPPPYPQQETTDSAKTSSRSISGSQLSSFSFRREKHGVSKSTAPRSSGHSVSLDFNDGNERRKSNWRTAEDDEHKRNPMEGADFQMSVSEALKLQPRKRVKLCLAESESEEEAGEAERPGYRHKQAGLMSKPSRGALPYAEEWEPNEEYEVEAIRDIIRNPDGTLRLLVKWKNWPESTNSWEPFSNTRCYEAIVEFLVEKNDSKYMPLVLHEYVQEKFQYPEINILTVCKLLDTGFDLTRCVLLDYREKLRLTEVLRETKQESLLRRVRRHFGDPLKFIRAVDSQHHLRDALLALQRKFTFESTREPPVYFENLIDSETPPITFTLIEDYSFADGISPRENECSCECVDCVNCSCVEFLGRGSRTFQNYLIDGRLTESVRTNQSHIFECGSRCSCFADCYNRVTQRGRPVEVTVYKTGPEKEWGLRTNSSIKAWTFVLEYLGVVKRYSSDTSKDDFPYVHELNAGGQVGLSFVVDSSEQGNVSRFINHSCNPNLISKRVLNQHADLRLPRLALFACRDIRENEELTLDYRTMKTMPASRARSFGFQCCCQENNCCGEL